MDDQGLDAEFAKQFWTTASLVVSFSIAQIIGFGLAVAAASENESNGLDFQIQMNFPAAILATLASAIVSVALVWFCQSAAREIMSTLPKSQATTRNLRIFDKVRIIATSIAGALSIILVLSIRCPGGSCPALSELIAQHAKHAVSASCKTSLTPGSCGQ